MKREIRFLTPKEKRNLLEELAVENGCESDAYVNLLKGIRIPVLDEINSRILKASRSGGTGLPV